MFSSRKLPKSNTKMAIKPTSWNVGLASAKGVIATTFTGSLIRAMQTQQAIFSIMQRFAGGLRWWMQPLPCDLEAAHEVLGKMKLQDGTILAEFQCIGKGKVTYHHTQHTMTEARYIPLISVLGKLASFDPSCIELRPSVGFLRAGSPSRL